MPVERRPSVTPSHGSSSPDTTDSDTTDASLTLPAGAAIVHGVFSAEEIADLIESASDSSGVDAYLRDEISAGFKNAFDVASRIETGELEPLSA